MVKPYKLRREAEISMTTFIEIIIFIILFFLIGLPVASRLIGFFTAKPDTGTIKSLDILKMEINNLKDERVVPLYIDKNHRIEGFSASDCPVTSYGDTKSCICICIKDKDCKGKGLNECRQVVYDVGGKGADITKIVVLPKEKENRLSNYKLTKKTIQNEDKIYVILEEVSNRPEDLT